MTNQEKVIKIFEVILEELNGYSKQDAKKYASENEGSDIWERITKIVGKQAKNLQKAPVSGSLCPRCQSNKIAESDENKEWMDCEWCSLRWAK